MSQPHLKPYAHYKDSGIDWLGEIPEHWEVIKSRRLFAQRNERAYPDDRQLTASQKYGVIYQDDFMNLEGRQIVKVITGADILKHVEPGDFVISMRSFQGGIEWCGNRGSISSAYVMLIPTEKVQARFFYYLLKSPSYIQALQSTSNLVRDGQALRYENFTLVDLPIIPIVEQQEIAEFLDRETGKIDELVAEQRRLIDLLKEKRQAVISHAVTKGLNPNAPMKDSDIEWLGEIPAHWQVLKGSHIGIFFGSEQVPEEFVCEEGELPFIKVGSLSLNTFSVESLDWYVDPKVSSQYTPRKNFIVFPKRGAAIFTNKVNIVEYPSLIDPNLMGWVLGEKVTLEYMAYLLKTRKLDELADISTVPQINNKHIAPERFPIPPIEEQKQIVSYIQHQIDLFEDLITQAERAIELLQERRTALISAAVTGKIDVRQAVKELTTT